MQRVLVFLAGLLIAINALSAIETYQFDNDVDRVRYQALIEELRCPKCQNQNLAGSDAPIAADLRREVYRMVVKGDSDQQIMDFMYKRYGDFVLYRPRFNMQTLALWAAPILLVLIGLGIWWRLSRRSVGTPIDVELSEAEKQKLAKVLESRDD